MSNARRIIEAAETYKRLRAEKTRLDDIETELDVQFKDVCQRMQTLHEQQMALIDEIHTAEGRMRAAACDEDWPLTSASDA